MSAQSASHPLARKHRDVIVLSLIVVFGLICAGIIFVHLDQPVCDLDRGWTEAPICRALLDVATWTGNWQLAPLMIVLLLVAARRHWKRLLNTLLVAYILRTAVVEWLKLTTGRPRPRQLPDATVFEGFGAGTSFPSGHASFSFMMAMIISAWFPRWRWPAWIGAILVSLSRVAVHAHFLSDVIVGAVIGTVAGTLVLWIWPAVTTETRQQIEEQYMRKQRAREQWLASPEGRAAQRRSRRLALGVLTVVLFIAAILLAYWFVDPLVGFHESAFFQQAWVQTLGELGRYLGTWDLAPLLIAVTLIAAGMLWKELLLSLLGGYALQTTLTELIKDFIGRARPCQIPDHDLFFGPGTEYHSLPSGHASFIFMFAVITGVWFPRWRIPLYALAVFVSLSRVALGAHYLSDVTVGALLGGVTAWVILAIWRPPHARRSDPESEAPSRPEGGVQYMK